MLLRTIFFYFLLLLSAASFGQNAGMAAFTSNLNAVVPERFKGGTDGFLRHFYGNIKYPSDARLNCTLGQLLAKVTISAEGEILSIQFLNKLGNRIEEEVETVLKATKGKWTASKAATDLYFSIAFELEGVATITGDMKATGYGGGMHSEGCDSNEEIEAKIAKALKKGKRDKAIEGYEELLRRYPLSAEYNKAYSELVENK